MSQASKNIIMVLEKSTIYWWKNLPKLPRAGMGEEKACENTNSHPVGRLLLSSIVWS